jgi:hypothetical protein
VAEKSRTPPSTDAHRELRTDRSSIRQDVVNACPLQFYGGIDGLVLLGVSRDLFVSRRVHTVYMIALPLLMTAQTIAAQIFLHRAAFWIRIARPLIR